MKSLIQSGNTCKKSLLTSLLTGLFLLFASYSAFAEHFHYFIDVETQFAVNPNKQLTELNLSWVYDEKMSALLKKRNPNLKALGQAIMNDLRKQHFFTNVTFNGKPVKTGQVRSFNLQEFTQNGKKALQLDFTLPLLRPLNMNGKNTLNWTFADPSGVGILVYYTQKNILLGATLQGHCHANMKENQNAQHGDPAQFLSLQCAL